MTSGVQSLPWAPLTREGKQSPGRSRLPEVVPPAVGLPWLQILFNGPGVPSRCLALARVAPSSARSTVPASCLRR